MRVAASARSRSPAVSSAIKLGRRDVAHVDQADDGQPGAHDGLRGQDRCTEGSSMHVTIPIRSGGGGIRATGSLPHNVCAQHVLVTKDRLEVGGLVEASGEGVCVGDRLARHDVVCARVEGCAGS